MNKIMLALTMSLITVASFACNCCENKNNNPQTPVCQIEGCKCGCHGGTPCSIDGCACTCHKKATCSCSCCKCACECKPCCRGGHRPPPPRDFNMLPPNGVCNVTITFGGSRPAYPAPQFQPPMQQQAPMPQQQYQAQPQYQQPAPQQMAPQQQVQPAQAVQGYPMRQITQTWIEGHYVDAVTRDGKFVKAFVPGHYEECMLLGQ